MPKKDRRTKDKPPNADIQVDMRVSLDIELKPTGDGKRSVLSLASAVEEISEDGALLIHMPLHHGGYYPLPRDDEIFMRFFAGAKMYALPVRFQERIMIDNLMYARVRRLGPVRQVQRRECYRLPCSLPVAVERQDKEPLKGVTVNLSDGGMLFAANEDIERGEKIALTFDIGRVETIKAAALRAERIEGGKYQYRTAVQFRFNNKDRAQKDRFYKYIVEKQSEKRRRLTQGIKPPYLLKKEEKGEFNDTVSCEE
jgi:c-di-GMP-binding flagellar brake protein YcgR